MRLDGDIADDHVIDREDAAELPRAVPDGEESSVSLDHTRRFSRCHRAQRYPVGGGVGGTVGWMHPAGDGEPALGRRDPRVGASRVEDHIEVLRRCADADLAVVLQGHRNEQRVTVAACRASRT